MRTPAPSRLSRVVLLTASLAACAPPAAAPLPADCPTELPVMVEVTDLDPSIAVEVRYATADNFTAAPLPGYETPRALLRPEAARSLARVQERLSKQGLGLKLWDAYRPVRATLAMVEWAERTGNEWVLDEGYVARRSGHNEGATVDLTLVRLDSGEELPMGTAYDQFSDLAHTANATGEVLRNRMVLLRAMEAEGWDNYPKEWWHYSYPGERDAIDAPLGCFP